MKKIFLLPIDIEKMIYVFREQRVMLDADLAKLYRVETKVLNRQVRRNMNRFPVDFMFQLSDDEASNLRCQIGTSSLKYGGRRYLPYVFTENGVAMLSSVLNSEEAIEVNILIIRIFTKLRSFLLMEKSSDKRIDQIEKGTGQMFKVVFERLDSIDERVDELHKTKPSLSPVRKKIGFK
jgi:hypothetical protein